MMSSTKPKLHNLSQYQEDRATAIGHIHQKIGKKSCLWFRRYPRGQTDMLITILRNRSRRQSN